MHNCSIYWRWKQIYTKEMESWLNVATAGHKHLNASSELMESPTSEPSTLRASLPVSVQYKQQSVLRTVQKTLETLAISKLATHTAFLKIKLHNINTVHKTQQSQIWARHGIASQELQCACSVFSSRLQRGCTLKHGRVLPEMPELLQISPFICLFSFFWGDRVSCSAGH